MKETETVDPVRARFIGQHVVTIELFGRLILKRSRGQPSCSAGQYNKEATVGLHRRKKMAMHEAVSGRQGRTHGALRHLVESFA